MSLAPAGSKKTLAKIAKIAKPEKQIDFERVELYLSSLAILAALARVS